MDENKIILTQIDHGERLERIEKNMVTKKDHEQLIGLLDEIKGIVKKQDEETVAMGQGVKRVEETAEQNKQDIAHMKPKLSLSEA